jgi:hypothetical protein
MGEDGYPAPYDYDENGMSREFAGLRYDPTEQCGWNEDLNGNFASVGAKGSHPVQGRCCDSPRAFRERMNMPMTACS